MSGKRKNRSPDWLQRQVKRGPGKGAVQRPVDAEKFAAEWDRIFGKKKGDK